MIKIFNYHFSSILSIINLLKISSSKIIFFTFLYLSITFLIGILDGFGLLLLVNLIFNNEAINLFSNSPDIIKNYFKFFNIITYRQYLILIIFIFFLTVIFKILIGVLDVLIWTYTRTKFQNKIYYNYINADWLNIYDYKVGDVAGTLSWEVRAMSKYCQNIFKVLFYFLLSFIFGIMALLTDFTVSIISGFLVLPILLVFLFVFKQLAYFSKKETDKRNIFMSDITERLNGLFQIIAENSSKQYHYEKGINEQKYLWKLELIQGFYQTISSTFTSIFLIFIVLCYFFYNLYFDPNSMENLSIFASIGVLGIKFLTSFNNLVSGVGNILRLTGSIEPVTNGMKIKKFRNTQEIKEKIISINLNNVSFNYKNLNNTINELNLKIKVGEPLIITGSSGSGKSTLANIIAGIYLPKNGTVEYFDRDKRKYESKIYQPNIGYVTQNVHMFRGSVKEFLSQDKNIDDNKIISILKAVDIYDFIESIGGIDSKIDESGRSFSGGQVKRLGIARVLIANSNIIILDEPTSGLDDKNKKFLFETLNKLSNNYIIIIISHEKITLNNSNEVKLKD